MSALRKRLSIVLASERQKFVIFGWTAPDDDLKLPIKEQKKKLFQKIIGLPQELVRSGKTRKLSDYCICAFLK